MSAPVPPSSSPLSKPLQVQPTGAAAAPAVMNMAQNSNPPHAHNVSFMNNSFGASAAAAAGGQSPAAYSPPKTQFSPSAYPHAIPATQCLPATTQPMQPAAVPPLQATDKPIEEKPQSNGTAEQKQNHITSPQKNNTSNTEKSDKAKSDKPEPSEVPQITVATSITSNTSTVPSSNSTTTPVILEKPKAEAVEVEANDKHDQDGSKAKETKETKEKLLEVKSPVKDVLVNLIEKSADKTPEKPSANVTLSSAKVEAQKHKEVADDTDATSIAVVKETKGRQADAKVEKKEDTSEVQPLKSVDKAADGKKVDELVQTEEAQSIPSTPTTPVKAKEQSSPVKSPMKVATTPRTPQRRSRTPKGEDSPRSAPKPAAEPKPSTSKSPGGSKTKRSRVRTQPYQSPLPELEIISKFSATTTTPKANESKLIVFFKNEFLAVRNSDGGFFVCQAVQNVYKSSSRIKIRWLSQHKGEKSGEIYTPDFYDYIDFECILTNLELSKVDKSKFRLPAKEHERTDNILKRAIAVEKGEAIALDDSMTEDNPDGLDVSLYTEEEQLTKRKGSKRRLSKGRPPADDEPLPKTPKKAGRKKAVPVSEPKRSTAGGRAERAKRRSAPEEAKTSPVIDNKKAKVLAKVVKRATATQSPKNTPTPPKLKAKETKVTKPAAVASTSKAKAPKPSPAARKTPKRGRK